MWRSSHQRDAQQSVIATAICKNCSVTFKSDLGYWMSKDAILFVKGDLSGEWDIAVLFGSTCWAEQQFDLPGCNRAVSRSILPGGCNFCIYRIKQWCLEASPGGIMTTRTDTQRWWGWSVWISKLYNWSIVAWWVVLYLVRLSCLTTLTHCMRIIFQFIMIGSQIPIWKCFAYVQRFSLYVQSSMGN